MTTPRAIDPHGLGRRIGGVAVVFGAAAASIAFVACSSNGDAPASPVDAGGSDVTVTDGALADSEAEGDAGDGGDDDFVVPDASVVCATTPCVKALAGTMDGYCALLEDGHARCWGANSMARLGVALPAFTLPTPTPLEGLDHIRQLEIGLESTCAIVEDGGVHCWGAAELVNMGSTPPDGGDPPVGAHPTPTRVDLVPSAERISVGAGFACVTVSDGALHCWGLNRTKQLGRGFTMGDEMLPPAKAVFLEEHAADVVAGIGRTFVTTPRGDLVSWGANREFGVTFLLGRDTSEDPNGQPTIVPGLSRVRSLSTTFSHACAVAGRFVHCWGQNANGELGRGGFGEGAFLPAKSILADVTDEDADASAGEHDVPVSVVTSPLRSCAVLGSGRVYCWGAAGSGRLLGPNVKGFRGTPTRIDGFSGPVVALAAGVESACALLRSGAVECWGANASGQLGIGSTDEDPHPTPLRVDLTGNQAIRTGALP